MTKALAAKRAKPCPPTQSAIASAKVLDLISELRPLKPPGNPTCRICRDTGCRMCGKEPMSKRTSHRADDSHMWQKGDR